MEKEKESLESDGDISHSGISNKDVKNDQQQPDCMEQSAPNENTLQVSRLSKK